MKGLRRARATAVVILLASVGLGTITDATPSREPIRAGGYEILSGDFHVHAFLGDGGIAPWMLQRHAARHGLDVIAITNHNQTMAARIGRASLRSSGPLIVVGEEITGRDFHLIAVGIERPVNWNQPARQAIADVHAQGGVAIAAHPLYGFAEGYDEAALASLDGLEAAHPVIRDPAIAPQIEEFYQRTLGRNPDVAAIGSSDFHTVGAPGQCRTYLFVKERSQAGVLEAIREGRTVGRCGAERLLGRPELVQLLEAHRDALAPPINGVVPRFAAFLTWCSLVALAIVGLRP